MPPLPSMDSMWYWPSRTESTIVVGSSSSTSPSLAQKLTVSSYFALQAGQYFIGDSSLQPSGADKSLAARGRRSSETHSDGLKRSYLGRTDSLAQSASEVRF